MSEYSLGLDFGTTSVRALLVDLEDGAEVGQAIETYPHGDDGVVVDAREPDLARQWPQDYGECLVRAVREALARAAERAGARPQQVVGIGVDTTGSTPIPVDRDGAALTEQERFAADPAAMAWLWKDHTAQAEADEITALARELRPQYLARCGGTYSAEWFWAKVLHCLRTAPAVFDAAFTWVEACDFVPAWLTGRRDPGRIRRSVCAAGHKAMFAVEWGGLPDREFLSRLDPQLGALRERLYDEAFAADTAAGGLGEPVAVATGLRAGTPVAVGAFDAHLGAVGAGVAEGDLVKVIGTSSCDMAVVRAGELPAVSGLCGVVKGSILPGYFGLEAGQSAVGDIFAWCREHVGGGVSHRELTDTAARLSPGESGLLALDWHNGNRSVLADPALSGAIIGLNLHTRAAEIYRAMIEATAFGARTIIDRMVSAGVPVQRLIACGGIVRKSPLLMQIYADVLGREMSVAPSTETCALGAAIAGATVGGWFPDFGAAQAALCRPPAEGYRPDPARAAVYDRLFALYSRLHDAFGRRSSQVELGSVMKELLAVRRAARGAG